MVNLGTMNWQGAGFYNNRYQTPTAAANAETAAGVSPNTVVAGESASTATTVPAIQESLENTGDKGQNSQSYIDISKPHVPQFPEIRKGADPVEMAVRGRIEYVNADQLMGKARSEKAAASSSGTGLSGTSDDTEIPGSENIIGTEKSRSAADAAEEAKCETCENRTYQDGSDDPGVSYKMPTKIDPDMAASEVRGHEMEHVVRNQAKAEREGRKVVQQMVMLHNAICPDCGQPYISGGTTRTVTKDKPERPDPAQLEASQAKNTGIATPESEDAA